MKNKILIVEPDTIFATRLAAALERGKYQATIVRHIRDACLILVQQPHDLAFVPAQSDDGLLRALLVLQPELPLVGIVPVPHTPLPQLQRSRLKTLLSKSRFDMELPLVLEAILQKPVSPLFLQVKTGEAQVISVVDMGRVAVLLQRAFRETGVTTAFIQNQAALAFAGEFNNEQAALIAARCQQTWSATQMTAQMQFYRLPGRIEEMLLYTLPVGETHHLVLAASPTTPLTMLRSLSEQLRPQLTELIGQEMVVAAAPLPQTPIITQSNTNNHTFAILWRAYEPIPDFLNIPLRRALERIARANACLLTHFDVTNQYVHLVVSCPPGRNSTWAAHLFKSGSERELQTQFQVRTSFWSPGHYATTSADPLSPAELDLFMQHPLAT